ncbi:MAG: hypothetical protein IKF39_03340 [Oscillospiraceae bacterium]|nr:hypothetical protein [Oscillospiraceae bacterium]
MDFDVSTTIEESIRKLRGIGYLLSSLSHAGELDPDHSEMYGLLADNIYGIAGELDPVLEKLTNLNI